MKVNLKWITPDADKMVAHMARVSNPDALEGDPSDKLIRYLLNHKHFSPFEMACMCVEIHATRDIARQILRHRSFHFQEFSQRYSKVGEDPELSEQARTQDTKNRQNSFLTDDKVINRQWLSIQNTVWEACWFGYSTALKLGIAKELARKLLPEGLTKTHMYMQGTLRDWLHYIGIREGVETQYEHREVARAIRSILFEHCPAIASAAEQAGIIVASGPIAENTQQS